jgi:hypothetical protein
MWVLVLQVATEPQVFDLRGKDLELVVPLDEPELELSAFVVVGPEGEVVLDDLIAAAQKAIGNVEYGDCTVTTGVSELQREPAVCVTLMGFTVCA